MGIIPPNYLMQPDFELLNLTHEGRGAQAPQCTGARGHLPEEEVTILRRPCTRNFARLSLHEGRVPKTKHFREDGSETWEGGQDLQLQK